MAFPSKYFYRLCHSLDGNYFLCYKTPSYELFGVEIDKEGFPIVSTKKKLLDSTISVDIFLFKRKYKKTLRARLEEIQF